MDNYDRLVWEIWLPKFRSVLSSWSPKSNVRTMKSLISNTTHLSLSLSLTLSLSPSLPLPLSLSLSLSPSPSLSPSLPSLSLPLSLFQAPIIINILEHWLPLLPEWIITNILESLILPRLQVIIN